jgi:hypothetical protein
MKMKTKTKTHHRNGGLIKDDELDRLGDVGDVSTAAKLNGEVHTLVRGGVDEELINAHTNRDDADVRGVMCFRHVAQALNRLRELERDLLDVDRQRGGDLVLAHLLARLELLHRETGSSGEIETNLLRIAQASLLRHVRCIVRPQRE